MDPQVFSISVVIPAHNAAATVERAVRSALSQVPPPDEVVVVDDGSEDGTGGVARASGARVIHHVKARGAAAARDAGARSTTQQLICFLDADDWLSPGYLSAVARAHDAHPAAALILGTSVEHHEDGGLRHPRPYSAYELDHPVEALAWDNRVPTSATTVPRWAYEQSGGFDPHFPGSAAEDFDHWLRLALCGPFTRAPSAVVNRAITSGSVSRKPSARDLMLRNGFLCVARNKTAATRVYPPFARVATAQILRESALRSISVGDSARALTELRAAVRSNPVDHNLWLVCALFATPPSLRPVLQAARRLIQSRRHHHNAQRDGSV